MTPKTRDVFISYSQEDKVTADTICAALESAGIRCWIAPRDVQPGRSFAGEITRAMEASKNHGAGLFGPFESRVFF